MDLQEGKTIFFRTFVKLLVLMIHLIGDVRADPVAHSMSSGKSKIRRRHTSGSSDYNRFMRIRPSLLLSLIGLLAPSALMSPVCGSAALQTHWVGTWATAVQPPGFDPPGSQPLRQVEGQSIRMIVPISLGGQRLRVRFSNRYGNKALTIGSAHVALRRENSAIVAGTDRPLLFAGKASSSIPPGALMVSDPVELALPDSSDVAVSVYIPGAAELKTTHGTVPYASYISDAGDFTGAAAFEKGTTKTTWYWLDGIEVQAPPGTGAVVALGDSITDGAASAPDSNGSWPSVLAKRLVAQRIDRRHQKLAVLNLGISGNRVLHDGAGVSALARFDSDVLARPGVRSLIVLEGINDIGFPNLPASFLGPGANPASDDVSSDEIISGLRQLVERAHDHGLKIYGGTLTPFEGCFYATPAGEAKRQAVNNWVRSPGAFDGVIDFDAVVRDPKDPTHMLAAYDSGDHLHPGNAGYRAMAEAIDLAMLGGGAAGRQKPRHKRDAKSAQP